MSSSNGLSGPGCELGSPLCYQGVAITGDSSVKRIRLDTLWGYPALSVRSQFGEARLQFLLCSSLPGYF